MHEALRSLVLEGALLTAEAIGRRLAQQEKPPALPTLTIPAISLSCYDSLLAPRLEVQQ